MRQIQSQISQLTDPSLKLAYTFGNPQDKTCLCYHLLHSQKPYKQSSNFTIRLEGNTRKGD